MSKKDWQTDAHQEKLNDQIPDGSGCAETWAALSEMREEDATGRRDFLTHVGLTLGVFSVGGSTLSSRVSASGDVNPDIETRSLKGRERGQLLRRANRSEDVRQIARTLGEKPKPTAVFEYSVNDDTGYGVTFGREEERDTTIRYYESSAFDDGVTALGGKPVGDGIRAVDGNHKTTMEFGTPLVKEVAKKVPENAVEKGTGDGSLAREEAILLRNSERFDVYVPITRGGDFEGRVVLTGSGEPTNVTTTDLSVAPKQTQDGVSTQNHIVCGPWGTVCTDYCTVLCSSLAGLSGAACTAACSGTVAGIPISPGCGAICAGVVGGTCYATCTNLTGH
ncbi:hypothetical protein [Halorussus aquaticus]|uniref:Uncharacterized protein n=1 Tax=Halorussus aquaticus TaxID=2953748 RepID=A0ABD5PWQ1_9EURY|nr:hypothetical protein [Halorussus aquaticus]